MDVPVQAGPLLEIGIDAGEESAREERGEEGVDGLIEDEGDDDLMNVRGESRETKTLA